MADTSIVIGNIGTMGFAFNETCYGKLLLDYSLAPVRFEQTDN